METTVRTSTMPSKHRCRKRRQKKGGQRSLIHISLNASSSLQYVIPLSLWGTGTGYPALTRTQRGSYALCEVGREFAETYKCLSVCFWSPLSDFHYLTQCYFISFILLLDCLENSDRSYVRVCSIWIHKHLLFVVSWPCVCRSHGYGQTRVCLP